jgi:hypothetical protein
MDDDAEDTPVVLALRAGVDPWKMRRDQCLLRIVQPEIIRHGSGPPGQFESRLGNQFNWVQNLGLRERRKIRPELKDFPHSSNAQRNKEGYDKISDEKTDPSVCAFVRTVPRGDFDDTLNPSSSQHFVATECRFAIASRLEASSEYKCIFDGHRGTLPCMRADGMGSIAHQNDRTFVPAQKGRHVVNGIDAVDSVNASEDIGSWAGITRVQTTYDPCVIDGISRLINFSLFSRIGVEPIDRLTARLEIAKERVAAERHPHQAASVGHLRLRYASGAEETREVRSRIFRKDQFPHTRA